eukprot:SAG11_NODE_835_length_6927_cov_2.877142_3_plen_53_part_00
MNPGACDCRGRVNDACGVCGGGDIPEGDCDCFGSVLDECDVRQRRFYVLPDS